MDRSSFLPTALWWRVNDTMDEVEQDELLVAFPSNPISLINCSRDNSLSNDVSLTSVVEAANPRDTGYELGDVLGGSSTECISYPIASLTFSILSLSNLCCLRLLRGLDWGDDDAGENVVFDAENLLKFVPLVFLLKTEGFVEVDQVEVVVQSRFRKWQGNRWKWWKHWHGGLWKKWENTIFSYLITESVSAPKCARSLDPFAPSSMSSLKECYSRRRCGRNVSKNVIYSRITEILAKMLFTIFVNFTLEYTIIFI